MAKVKIIIEKLDQNIIIQTKKEKVKDAINAIVDGLIEEKGIQVTTAYGMVIGVLTDAFKIKKVKDSDEEFKIVVKAPSNVIVDVLNSYADAVGIDMGDDEYFDDEDEEYNNNEYDEEEYEY